MYDPNPKYGFSEPEPDDDRSDGIDVDSVPNLEADESRYSRPTLRYIDVHDRPTLIP